MENLKSMVLERIPNKRAEAIPSKELQALTGLPLRKLKEVITELRKTHPICSKEIDGGGYWMAENESDIREFIIMIARRRDAYNKTINRMQRHLDDV
jgi:DNA-binding IscR family transcriptional regulator